MNEIPTDNIIYLGNRSLDGAPRRPRKQRRSRVANTLVIRNALLLAVRTGKAFREQHRDWGGRLFSAGGFDFSYCSPSPQGRNYRLELWPTGANTPRTRTVQSHRCGMRNSVTSPQVLGQETTGAGFNSSEPLPFYGTDQEDKDEKQRNQRALSKLKRNHMFCRLQRPFKKVVQ